MAAEIRDAERLLQVDNFSEFGIGAYLGLDWTPEQEAESERRALELLQDLEFLPTRQDITFCGVALRDRAGRALLDANGDPLLCQRIMRANNYAEERLGFLWTCTGNSDEDVRGVHNRKRLSPLENSIFSGQHLPFRKFVKILYCYLQRTNVTKTAATVPCSSGTAVQWFVYLRETFATVAWHDLEKIGGIGDVVEIDEALVFKRKNNVGRVLVGQHCWVFGGVSRTTGKRFAMRVVRRNMDILEAEIVDNIHHGTRICSDGWRAYNNISEIRLMGFGPTMYSGHDVVIHDRHFVDPPRGEPPFWRTDINYECRDKQFIGPWLPPHPVDGPLMPYRCHTQKVERNWRELKRTLKSTRSYHVIDMYIGEYLYRENIEKPRNVPAGENFKLALQDLKRVYPGHLQVGIRPNRPNARIYAVPANGQLPIPLCQCDRCLQ